MTIATEIAAIKSRLDMIGAPAPVADTTAIEASLNELAGHVADMASRLADLSNFVGNASELA